MASEPPSQEWFLTAPRSDVAQVAPETLIFSAGGTRRHAVFEGVSPESEAFFRWSQRRIVDCFNLIFQHGVHHIFSFTASPNQFRETTPGYRDRLMMWIDRGAAGDNMLIAYKQRGWRVRLCGTEDMPQLQPAAERLIRETPETSEHTLWWLVIPDTEAPWRRLLSTVHASGASTRDEATEAMYGEVIPAATLFLSFGKPIVSPVLIPPLIGGAMQCYWLQRPSYALDKLQFREILYDYAYLRQTWQADKTGRAEKALAHRSAWERGPTLGLGMQLGPFWYPRPSDLPSD